MKYCALVAELSTRDMMKRMMEAVEDVAKRAAFIEKRAMNENMLPHEALRMYDNVLHEFNPMGDVSWPLRQFRDITLSYFRALSVRYADKLEEKEKTALCEVVLFEAMKRYTTHTNDFGRAKYKFMVALAEAQEERENELGFFSDCLWV